MPNPNEHPDVIAKLVAEHSKKIADMTPYDRPLYIRSKLPAFNYEPSPPPDNVERITIPMTFRDDIRTYGRDIQYEGETDLNLIPNGRGVQYFPGGTIYEGY